MSGGFSSNIKDVSKRLKAEQVAIRARIGRAPERICADINEEIHKRTPVHTGEAVRNMVWTKGAPNMTAFDPINNGPTGDTGFMSIGEEPRRPPNEEAAKQTFEEIRGTDPFEPWWLSNVSPDIVRIEVGDVPEHPRAPSPAMFRMTLDVVYARLQFGYYFQ